MQTAIKPLPARRSQPRINVSLVLCYVTAIAVALITLFPFLWMVSSAFKSRPESVAFPPTLFPLMPTLSNFDRLFAQLNIGQLYWNTLYVSVIKTVIMIYGGALLGYVFAKIKFPGREWAFGAVLITMIIPFEVYFIPLYQLVAQFNLGNTHLALILPHLFSAYAIFFFRQFMYGIPDDLIHAARIDGLGEWGIFNRVVLPLSGAALATMTAFYFMWNWNDFFWPLIVINERAKMMLPNALASLVAERGNDFPLVNAGATIAVVPILLLFLLLQRYVVQGIAITGIK
jgi:multiple sugar transport system permease protein